MRPFLAQLLLLLSGTALFSNPLILNPRACGEELGIKAPEGFQVTLFAADELAHDIYSMTIDSHGRVVVAGAGYVKILHNDDSDGKADRATLFSDKPASGAHGMVFDGDDLICTGDNSLMKLRDTNGDGIADGQPEIWATLKSSEHGANGVVHGPDGWIYVVCGNDAGVTAAHATLPTSPVKKPQAGAVLRFSPDGKQSEIFAHGFRNPYDLDFNAHGQLFTVDSDNERDHHLPWYAPTRLFAVAEGMHHGWVLPGHTRSWNRPPYFPDVAPRLSEIGRGSPTGLVVYRHHRFGPEFQGDVFSACWTLGRVYRFDAEKERPLEKCQPTVFLETTGDTGFAPVDLAIGPEGDMFVAIGGRGTRGGVFRVSHSPVMAESDDAAVIHDELYRLLTADQPLSAWSRKKWLDRARKLDRQTLMSAIQDMKRSLLERTRAVELLAEHFGGLTDEEAKQIADQVEVVRVAASLAGAKKNPDSGSAATSEPYDQPNEVAEPFSIAAESFFQAETQQERLRALRRMELSLGDIDTQARQKDVYAGYTLLANAESLQSARGLYGLKLAGQFPSVHRDVNLELARLLGMLEVEDESLLDRMTDLLAAEGQNELDVIHYLIVLSRLPGKRSLPATQRTARALLRLYPATGTVSRNWPLRVAEMTGELYRRDSRLAEVIASSPDLARPWQTLLVTPMEGPARQQGIRGLLAAQLKEETPELEITWTEELVTLVAELPSLEAFPILREAWSGISLQDVIVLALAKSPTAIDREKFLAGLSSVQASVVEAAAQALSKLEGKPDKKDLAVAFGALRQSCLAAESKSTREAVCELLAAWTGATIVVEESPKKRMLVAYQPWFDWLAKEHPEIARQVAGFGDATSGQWHARLQKVEWGTGDEARGLAVFQKKACHRCHAGNSPLGPSLAGAAGRFSRDDLFGAILDPHKEVAPPYQTTQIATSSGKVYSGLLVYESPDGTLMQTTPDITIRIAGDEIISTKKSKISLMPSGLLNDVSDQDVADLYAYLRTLKSVK